jgi:hypothetical protein
MRAHTFRGIPQYVYKEKAHGSKNEILKREEHRENGALVLCEYAGAG